MYRDDLQAALSRADQAERELLRLQQKPFYEFVITKHYSVRLWMLGAALALAAFSSVCAIGWKADLDRAEQVIAEKSHLRMGPERPPDWFWEYGCR